MTLNSPETWFPDRRPTWLDVAVAGFALVWLASTLGSLEAVSWAWVAAGLLLFAVAAGPAAKSSAGKSVGEWFRGIGVWGRVLVISLFAVAVRVADNTVGVPATETTSFVAGVMVGVVIIVSAYVLHAGEVDGWTRA